MTENEADICFQYLHITSNGQFNYTGIKGCYHWTPANRDGSVYIPSTGSRERRQRRTTAAKQSRDDRKTFCCDSC